MILAEAIKGMREGKKITHRHFSPDEWMTIENGKILLEDGVRCSITEFFRWRQDPSWQSGYEIYSE